MTGKILADSTPLYTLAAESDALHERAHRDFDQILDHHFEILVPYPVLGEAHRLILHRLGVAASRQWLDEIESGFGFLNASAKDYTLAIRRLAEFPDQRITLVDALTAVLAIDLAIPVWTYDHHFDILGAPVWR